jgi:hypothetical protein
MERATPKKCRQHIQSEWSATLTLGLLPACPSSNSRNGSWVLQAMEYYDRSIWDGTVVSIHIAREAAATMQSIAEVRALPGRPH